MEYGSSVRDPHTVENKHKVETIQRRAARLVAGNYDYCSSTTNRLKELKWTPLEERRAKNKALSFYKAKHGQLEIPMTDFKKPNDGRTRAEDSYNIPRSRTDTYFYSFFPSTVRLWNGLPADMKKTCKTGIY